MYSVYKNFKFFNFQDFTLIMEGSDQEKILQYLMAVEKLGLEIISDKKQIVMIDKLRNNYREALRDLKNSGQKKCYITIGSILVKNNVDQAISLLEGEQIQLNININKMRSDLKLKVNDLRDLEMQPPVPGLSLVPISDKEKTMFSKI